MIDQTLEEMKQHEKDVQKLWANYLPNKTNQKAFWADYEARLAQLKKERLTAPKAVDLTKTQQAKAKKTPKETPLAVFKPRKPVYYDRLRSLFIAPFSLFLLIMIPESEFMSNGEGFIVYLLLIFFGFMIPLMHAGSAYVFSITKSGMHIQRAFLDDREYYFAWRNVQGIEIMEDAKTAKNRHILVIEPYGGNTQSFVYHLSREEHHEFIKMIRWQVPHFDCRSNYYKP